MISKHSFFKTFCAGLLIVSFVFAPVSLTQDNRHTELNETEAFFGAGDPATMWLWFKEEILDGIVWYLINLVLEEIIKSTTEWVQNGFRDSPAFVTDFSGFMSDVSDIAESDFIRGTPLEELCSPFKFQIRAALHLNYNQTTRYRARCTLDDIVDNIDDFFDGDFYSGGWAGWDSMFFNENNNAFGSTFQAQAGLDAAIRTQTGAELKFLEFGSGYFGQEECVETEDGEEVCRRVTPGETVNESVNNALNIGNNRLELADEFNELFGALFSQLMKQVLGKGGGGLAGFTPTSEEKRVDGVPTGDDARGLLDAVNQEGKQEITEQQETLGILADAAEYCRNEFNRPLSEDLMGAGYSFAWNPDEEVGRDSLQNRADEYMDNDCEELP
jgi:hypothetical protein